MPAIFNIPHQARFWQVSASFVAEFNTVDSVVTGTGKYDFGQLVNQNVQLLPVTTKKNTVYFIDTINIGGDLSEADYLEAINTVPLARFTRKLANEAIYPRPLPVVNFVDNQQITAWLKDAKGGNEIQINFSGLLDQTAALVGVQFVNIFMQVNIYAIESSLWVAQFEAGLLPGAGVDLRRTQ